MQRRMFIAVVCGVAAWPGVALAQAPKRVRQIAYLTGIAEEDPVGQSRISAFRQELAKLGWIEGDNVQVTIYAHAGDPAKLRSNAVNLTRTVPDAILVNGATALRALSPETTTIPTVFVNVGEATAKTFVASLAHPGGNMTGFSMSEATIGQKWLEVLKEIAPGTTRVLVINSAKDRPGAEAVQTVAEPLNIALTISGVRNADEIERAIDEFAREENGAMLVLPTSIATLHRDKIAALAARYRLPAVYPYRFFAEQGGLLSYGVDVIELHRRAASYVDRILRGEKPGNLPVQAPTKYELVINLRTANALGISVPPTLLVRADEVIE